MRAKLSVVIPTLEVADTLPACLTSLMEGVEAGLIRELVLSDGGSNDATLDMAEEAGAIIARGPASRGGQLRRGGAAASGDWLLFLHADSVLPVGWSDVVAAQIGQGQPAYFKLSFDAPGVMPRLVAGWANLRSALFKLPYGDQGLLISRRDYDAVGGYADIPLMEDVKMARSLGGRLRAMPMRLQTSAARYLRDGWGKRGLRNLRLLLRYLAGADPENLTRRY